MERKWNRTSVSGQKSESDYVNSNRDLSRPGNVRFKITGKTSSGRNVKVEDKGDGKGSRVYKGEGKNGNG